MWCITAVEEYPVLKRKDILLPYVSLCDHMDTSSQPLLNLHVPALALGAVPLCKTTLPSWDSRYRGIGAGTVHAQAGSCVWFQIVMRAGEKRENR